MTLCNPSQPFEIFKTFQFIQLLPLYNKIQKFEKVMQKYSKLQWSQQEQQFLKELREGKSLKSWKFISGLVNQKFPDRNRNGKQCRQRYMNYVRFDQQKPKILDWDEHSDLILFENFLLFGAKWVLISNHMVGRSQNCLKNRFYGALRRVIRKINKIQKEKKLKYKKSIKYDSLIRVLCCKTDNQQVPLTEEKSQKAEFILKLRKDLINLAINQAQACEADDVLSLIIRIHQFNCFGRSVALKKTCSIPNTEDSIIIQFPNISYQLQDSIEDVTQQKQPQKTGFVEHQRVFECDSQSQMHIINENNLKIDKARTFDEEIQEILNFSYLPSHQFYF